MIAVAVYMSSSQSNVVSTTDNKNDTPAEEEDPVAEASDDNPLQRWPPNRRFSRTRRRRTKKKEEIVEEEDVVKEVPPKDEPATKPSEISGLVGWYQPKIFLTRRANGPIHQRGNHATEIKGRPEKVTEDGVTFVMGGNATGIRFPTKVMTRGRKFTMFTVAIQRRAPRSTHRRVRRRRQLSQRVPLVAWEYRRIHRRQSSSGTGWISHPHYRRNLSDEQEAKWVLNVEQKHLHRMDGHQRSGQTNGRARIPLQMSINHGDYTPHPHSAYWAKQQSDWAAGDIVFYNRELSSKRSKKVETYLMRKYKIEREARPHYSNRNFYAREQGWLNPFPDCRGSACAEQFKSLGSNRMGSDCGPEGAMSRSYFHRHHRTPARE